MDIIVSNEYPISIIWDHLHQVWFTIYNSKILCRDSMENKSKHIK
jgi:hypothetical protein